MRKILLGNLVVFAILMSISFEHNEVATNSKEETKEVDLMSIFPFEY
ncbi:MULTISPECIES: hypothetical protein [Bacillus cereus group]|uniref:PapR protein n=1 Tax=Bacillus cereus HuA2-1 TaxID=1053201 RepID=J9BDW5_BACCE|nr:MULTISPECIES: hypothetical protein [Bacillus cereus group]EJV76939.1 hypothetical protein IG3_05188 [Bacillus cereus HuA2-1]